MSSDDTLLAADQNARLRALDVTQSCIVQAPAGSGKTELLIQRYLGLLAIVNHPEEVVAITFTRKAAAEMRVRVLTALHAAGAGECREEPHERLTNDAARAVLDRDRELGWKLTEFPRRLRIQTLDALGAGIARSLPLSSAIGGTQATLADTEMQAIYRIAAAATLDWLATADPMHDAVERILVHLDNNTGVYIDYVARMLETRDQWLMIIGSGGSTTDDACSVRDKLEQNIGGVINGQLSRVSKLLPAALTENLTALAAHAGANARKIRPDHRLALLENLSELPGTDPDRAEVWVAIAELLLTGEGDWRRRIDRSIGFPPDDKEKKKDMAALLEQVGERDELRKSLHRIRDLPPHRYSDEQWQVLLALFKLLPVAVSELSRVFVERGVVDHIEVALAASRALGSADDPGDMALLLDYQIKHVLVDEMQDTSISQYHFLEQLVAGWEEGDGRTLFCVGDPMQSIYRFRNAEVGQFLVARTEGIGGVTLNPLVLRRNFRSGENLVHWFNETFRRTMPVDDDVFAGAIAYSESVAVEDHAGQGQWRVYPLFGGDRVIEAKQGFEVIQNCLNRDKQESIAVLVRSRAQLPCLLAELRQADIEYQAVELDRLTDLPEIIDVLALTRALCHFGDRIAWLALLRGPWVGLTWKDLHDTVKDDSHGIVWQLLQDKDLGDRLSDDALTRVRAFVQVLRPHVNTTATRSLRDRVELAWYALGGPGFMRDRQEIENVYRFFDVLGRFETAGSLADIARLESLLDDERVSSLASSACRLQVMTMHRAKGLQFDHVVLYGLGRSASGREKSVLSWLNIPGKGGAGEMIISPVGPRSELDRDALHRFIEISDSGKDLLEQDRLLYVACTRARRSLHLLGHVALKQDGQSFRPPRAGSLLHRIWPSVEAEFENAFTARQDVGDADDEGMLVSPPLRRFASEWRFPESAALPKSDRVPDGSETSVDTQVEYYWVGSSARHAGTIVHRWLQKASDGALELEVDRLSELRPINEQWSAKLGVPTEEISEVCDRVEIALRGILTDPQGQWALRGKGHAELAITGLWRGKVESAVIDRVRIDENGVHWIIDYKTSTHEGGDLKGFLEQESERYRAQLQRYGELYSNLAGAPVRAALYFPMLQEFREVSLE